jgi:UDP-4-amino-4-deoxy-L-arabinose formyltransferase/UDP-glucuronic acid dehydrogenase (UDP-4-keto-hexauronic acid decarboxylating)
LQEALVKAVVFGVREFGATGLEVLLSLDVKVPLVVTLPRNPADPPGYRPLVEVARARGIPVATPPDATGRALLDWIRAVKPDVLFSFQYAHFIPRTVRGVARRGAFNLHLSLLPRWRGRYPIPFLLLAGERESGVTLHEMTDDFDTGDVVAQVNFPLAPRESATTLYDKCVGASRLLLRRAVPLISEGRISAERQDPHRATVCPRLAEVRALDRTASVDRFDRTVRALTRPYPGARVPLGGETVVVWEGEPGEGAAGIPIPLADGMFRILRLSFENEAEMDWREFLRRYPDAPELLGRPRPPIPSKRAAEEE